MIIAQNCAKEGDQPVLSKKDMRCIEKKNIQAASQRHPRTLLESLVEPLVGAATTSRSGELKADQHLVSPRGRSCGAEWRMCT